MRKVALKGVFETEGAVGKEAMMALWTRWRMPSGKLA